jgi:preprotein translocase subunit SecD
VGFQAVGFQAVVFQKAKGLPARGLLGLVLAAVVFGAMLCGCRSPHHAAPAPTSTTTTTTATMTTHSAAPVVPIQPLSARPVQKSQPATSDECPATNPEAPVAPTDILVTCDLARATRYTLGPEMIELGLAQVDPPKSLTSGYYEVTLRLDPPSAAAWASFTAAHVHHHVAFVRDDLVLEAPIIEEHVTSGRIALTTQSPELADQLARLAGRPA